MKRMILPPLLLAISSAFLLGSTLSYFTDRADTVVQGTAGSLRIYDELVLLDFSPFGILFENSKSDYISLRDYAKKHGKSIEQIKVFCQKGRIVGAKKINNRAWVIPADAPYPEDNRLTANGKYVGFRERNAKR